MLVQSKPTMPSGVSSATAPLIRVVDDEAAIQALFERIGKLCGFEVDCHGTAESFLNAYSDDRSGCLVIDLMLPDRSGIEVLQEVTERGCELPIVFMSGMARVSEAVQALKLGSIDFVEKPFDVQKIAEILRRAVDIDPGYGRAHFNLAVLLRDQRNVEGALTHFETATRTSGIAALAYLELGKTKPLARDLHGGVEALEQALRLDPTLDEARELRDAALRASRPPG